MQIILRFIKILFVFLFIERGGLYFLSVVIDFGNEKGFEIMGVIFEFMYLMVDV